MTDNVLLHLGEEPRFDAIQTADIKPALQTAIAEALSIVAGFRTHATAMRLYGLMLVMLMVLKLAVIDMSGQNSITRILSLLVAGVICFALSVAYSRLSAHLSGTSEETEDFD